MRTPLVTDDDPEAALRRALDDLENVAPQERLAARQDRHALGREGREILDYFETLLSAELAAVGEILRADERLGAGVEIAVLAGEIAAVGQIPGDDVGSGEFGRVHRALAAWRLSDCSMR